MRTQVMEREAFAKVEFINKHLDIIKPTNWEDLNFPIWAQPVFEKHFDLFRKKYKPNPKIIKCQIRLGLWRVYFEDIFFANLLDETIFLGMIDDLCTDLEREMMTSGARQGFKLKA